MDLVLHAATTVKESGGRAGTTDVLIGSPAHEIVHYAENQNAHS